MLELIHTPSLPPFSQFCLFLRRNKNLIFHNFKYKERDRELKREREGFNINYNKKKSEPSSSPPTLFSRILFYCKIFYQHKYTYPHKLLQTIPLYPINDVDEVEGRSSTPSKMPGSFACYSLAGFLDFFLGKYVSKYMFFFSTSSGSFILLRSSKNLSF